MTTDRASQRIGVLIFALAFALASEIRFIPPQDCCFAWQRQILALVQITHGLGNLAYLAGMFLPGALGMVAYFLGLFAYGWLVGQLLWKWRTPLGMALIVVLLVVHVLVGGWFIRATDTLVGEPYASCQTAITETIAVRNVAYPETGFLPGAHFFFAITRDAGRTWQPIMSFRHDDPVRPSCAGIRSTGPNHIWLWMGWKLAVTDDTGQTWRIWEPRQSWPDWRCCNYGLIEDVTFDDALNGRMTLDPIGGRSEAPQLQTRDGGVTWK